MTGPVTSAEHHPGSDQTAAPPLRGRLKAAALMHALGEDAAPVWAALTEAEAHLIAGDMQHLPPDNPGSAERTLAALLDDGLAAPLSGAQPALAPGSVWQQLEQVSPRRLAAFLAGESAQAAAIILSRIRPAIAGATVRALPEEMALAILHRMVALNPPAPAVLAAIEAGLERFLQSGAGSDTGTRRVAELIEALGDRHGPDLLEAFAATAHGQADAVRSLMVPFEAIADFTPAGLQTLLSELNHDTLALALKGASERVRQAVFANMTQRARTVLHEDMEALGPVPRSDVEAARLQLVALARELIGRGDIRPAHETADEELVE